MDGVHMVQNSSTNCTHFADFHMIVILRSTFASLGAFACIVSIFIIIYTKSLRLFMYRLMFYLSVTTFIVCTLYILRLLPIDTSKEGVLSVKGGMDWLCSTTSYLFMVVEWTKLAISCWITFYLFLLAVFSVQLNKRKHEVAGLVIAVVASLSITWVPFINNMYGISGPFCSIKVTSKPCSSDVTLGMTYLISVYYAPFLLTVALNFLGMSIMAACLCSRWINGGSALQNHYKAALRDALPFLLYPALSDIITMLGLINRIYYGFYTVREERGVSEVLWYTQLIASPLDGMLIPIILLLHQFTLWRRKKKRQRSISSPQVPVVTNKQQSTYTSDGTQFIVDGHDSFTEVGPLIVKSSIKNNKKTYSDVEITL